MLHDSHKLLARTWPVLLGQYCGRDSIAEDLEILQPYDTEGRAEVPGCRQGCVSR
jgi:hypothetical protein